MEKVTELNSILKELHNITGFRISLHDMKFHEVDAYPQRKAPYCELIQRSDDGLKMCKDNDAKAFKKVAKTNETYLYMCYFGMYEAVAPITVLGEVIGYLMMGQFISQSEESKKNIISNALKFVDDESDVVKTSELVITSEANGYDGREKITSCIKILDICAQYVALGNKYYIKNEGFAKGIKNYLDNNFRNKITIQSVCIEFLISRTKAMVEFKETFGCGINQYLNKVRVDNSKKLLRGTEKSIKDVALKCGFSDQGYFTKVFLKHTGITPSKYRDSKESL